MGGPLISSVASHAEGSSLPPPPRVTFTDASKVLTVPPVMVCRNWPMPSGPIFVASVSTAACPGSRSPVDGSTCTSPEIVCSRPREAGRCDCQPWLENLVVSASFFCGLGLQLFRPPIGVHTGASLVPVLMSNAPSSRASVSVMLMGMCSCGLSGCG